jgi:hypothetical protein
MPSATSGTEFVAADNFIRHEWKHAIIAMAKIEFEIFNAG